MIENVPNGNHIDGSGFQNHTRVFGMIWAYAPVFWIVKPMCECCKSKHPYAVLAPSATAAFEAFLTLRQKHRGHKHTAHVKIDGRYGARGVFLDAEMEGDFFVPKYRP